MLFVPSGSIASRTWITLPLRGRAFRNAAAFAITSDSSVLGLGIVTSYHERVFSVKPHPQARRSLPAHLIQRFRMRSRKKSQRHGRSGSIARACVPVCASGWCHLWAFCSCYPAFFAVSSKHISHRPCSDNQLWQLQCVRDAFIIAVPKCVSFLSASSKTSDFSHGENWRSFFFPFTCNK